MSKASLILFTEKFPFIGGEPFLETEIHFLAEHFTEVTIVTLHKDNQFAIVLPDNVRVDPFNFDSAVSLLEVLKNNWKNLSKWFIYEIWKSPHRMKYLMEFKWNFNRLIGIAHCADRLVKHFGDKLMDAALYTYWFNEWASVLSMAKEKNSNISFTTRLHLFDFEEEFQSRKYLPFRYVEISKPTFLLPISDYAKKYIENKWPYVKNKTQVHRLGVLDKGNNPEQVQQEIVLVSCSSLSWYKQPNKLAEIIGKLDSEIVWHHFGDGPLRVDFLNSCSELPDNITFKFHGHVPNSEIINFYQGNHVTAVLNTSIFEGIPVALMEAISFGIPVIGFNICGMPELVNESTGLLLDRVFSSDVTAENINNYLRNLKSSARKRAKKYWREHYDATQNYEESLKVIGLSSDLG